jgi:hypothetical protein
LSLAVPAFPRPAALATSFAHRLGPEAILDVLARAHAAAVVLDAGLGREPLEVLSLALEHRRAELPVLAIEAPCPLGPRSAARLCATSREEAQVALDEALGTVRRAAALGARFVVVSLSAPHELDGDWECARARFVRGELDAQLGRRLWHARAGHVERALDMALRALDRLGREAERVGVSVAVKNGRRYVELPSLFELDRLLEDLRGAPVVPLFDSAAAHLVDAMGFVPLDATAHTFAGPFAYLGDACGPVGALAPGRGVLDLAVAAAHLPAGCVTAFRPWAGLSVEEVITSMLSWS